MTCDHARMDTFVSSPQAGYGVPEDRTREQFTARITRHPKGKPGHVYVAQDIAYLRANTLTELQATVADFAWERTPA